MNYKQRMAELFFHYCKPPQDTVSETMRQELSQQLTDPQRKQLLRLVDQKNEDQFQVAFSTFMIGFRLGANMAFAMNSDFDSYEDVEDLDDADE